MWSPRLPLEPADRRFAFWLALALAAAAAVRSLLLHESLSESPFALLPYSDGELYWRRAGEIALMNLDRIPRDRAGFGSTVELRASTGENVVYQLVMPEEADVEKGLISTSSPIGRAILNKEEGDEISVTTPSGKRNFELVKLTTIHDE